MRRREVRLAAKQLARDLNGPIPQAVVVGDLLLPLLLERVPPAASALTNEVVARVLQQSGGDELIAEDVADLWAQVQDEPGGIFGRVAQRSSEGASRRFPSVADYARARGGAAAAGGP